MLEEGGIARWHGGRGERGVIMGLCATVFSGSEGGAGAAGVRERKGHCAFGCHHTSIPDQTCGLFRGL